MKQLLKECRLCPRNCGVNRLEGAAGFCGCSDMPVIASAAPHHGEERVLSGRNGSGTIFFTACNLRCVFCQNDDISFQVRGKTVDTAGLASVIVHLENLGCHNINFVTPEPYIPHIIEAITAARSRGLQIPVAYNSSAYVSIESLRLLEGYIDIYMPDLKFLDEAASKRYLHAEDYPEVARAALIEMQRQVGDLQTKGGLAVSGLLVRHLVMPGFLDDTETILDFLYNNISSRVYVNIMGQYRPAGDVSPRDYPEIYGTISRETMIKAVRYAREIGIARIDKDYW